MAVKTSATVSRRQAIEEGLRTEGWQGKVERSLELFGILGPVITDRRFSVTAAVNNELILTEKCDYVRKTPAARVRLAPFDYVVAFPCVSVCGYPVRTRVWQRVW